VFFAIDSGSMLHRFIADSVLIAHLGFVLFVVLGGVLRGVSPYHHRSAPPGERLPKPSP
jgi:hypothetical protein